MQHISDIITKAKQSAGGVIAVAAAQDSDVLAACVAAQKEGIARPIFVGDEVKIAAILTEMSENPTDFEVIPATDDADSAAKAVALVREGRAGFLMKGLMSTGSLMKAVVDKELGLRTGNLLSHCMLYEVPGHGRLLNVTDGGMNTFPDLEKKAGILENAARTMQALGYTSLTAACVCGAEAVDAKIQATVDAEALSGMQGRWSGFNMTVFGPVGLDLAISQRACEHKGYTAPGAGEADILLVPTYEVGNALGKSLTYFANAKSAGIIVGAKVPIVLVSRSDTAETKLASIAFGAAAVV